MPPEDDLVLLDVAVPPVADEPVLGLAVVAALPALGEDAAAAGCALDCEVLGFGALWQPASAKRTAEAKINFFIICSPISVGVKEPTLQPPIISNVEPAWPNSFMSPHARLTRVLRRTASGGRRSGVSGNGRADKGAQRAAAAPARAHRDGERSGPRHDTRDCGRRKGTQRNPPRRSHTSSPR